MQGTVHSTRGENVVSATRLFNGINVVSIPVPDLELGRSFYRDALGLGAPVYDLPETGWIEFETGSPAAHLALTRADEGWAPSNRTTILLNVDDCNAACETLRQRGVLCKDPVVVPGALAFCSFYDPFGNRLQMCSPTPGEAAMAV
jgi:predicted enzyme related to lactoylglutathione lyase